MKVLFIGNSFTFVNDLPAMLENLSGGEITYGKVLRGGAYLKWYADPEHELGVQVREKAKETWDAVILQDQSFNPARDRDDCVNQTKVLRLCSRKLPCSCTRHGHTGTVPTS